MKNEEKHTREDILNTEIFTTTQAREYVKKQLKIGNTYYKTCVMPTIRHKFKPILMDFRRKRLAHLVIKKEDIDDFIFKHKKKLFE